MGTSRTRGEHLPKKETEISYWQEVAHSCVRSCCEVGADRMLKCKLANLTKKKPSVGENRIAQQQGQTAPAPRKAVVRNPVISPERETGTPRKEAKKKR